MKEEMVNIDTMTGKELGIAVAKEVMGWTRCSLFNAGGPFPQFQVWPEYLLVWDRVDQAKSYRHDWAPWRDMNDAWEVVEKRDTLFHLWGDSKGVTACFTIGVGRFGTATLDVPGYGDTAPLAVLRAALKAAREKK